MRSGMKEINEELLAGLRKDYEADQNARVLQGVLAKADMGRISCVPENSSKLAGAFTYEIKTRGITAQEMSGRCWLFAALNILREKVSEKLKIEEFELSQNYLSFYDKLEKANNFLQMVIDHADEPVKGQLMQYVLRGMSDGGYWCPAADLIEKYGVLPKAYFPETFQSGHTIGYINAINKLLRKDAMELRELVAAGKDPYERKSEMMAEIYKAQCIAFGQPPRVFDFTWKDKKEKFHEDRNLTPQEFYKKYTGFAIRDYAAVINEPLPGRAMDTPITFHGIENMVGRDMTALNISQEALEELCVKMLKGGEAIWIACDAGAYLARKEGIWDPDSVTTNELLGGFSSDMEKGKALLYSQSSANHAVLLTGVHLDEEGKPDRWKIENSWGKDVGKGGYFTCSEAYFKRFVYEAAINKKYFTKDQLAMLDKEPERIHAWDEDL